ncbi:c-type cytochrome [Psychrobacter sp. AOP22-C1-22]|uniref:c-type cytochrome n=1 Tax=unclassified Psychrobacter TaxID=196806 RepID=UPI0017888176|nr:MULTISPECIES: c-type cytochrome [unclassified Psychrobacter]MBE0407762.1 c-type cytochrome [Psychrobacter sp. FME6]MBE0445701.1 c-type cytochrome [Psychrobacter sp. FME5]MDN5802337.1 c-type cytochrome [Psychrobacter sp.]MDN5892133.1 c-type cytochrome [Psychrobacter sp.]
MKKIPNTNYSSLLVATIFAISAASVTGCSNSEDTKAVDRVEEAAALARVKDLESRAEALKDNMPAANDTTAPTGGDTTASAKPSIKMPDQSTIPDDEFGAAVKRGLQLANHTYKELPDNVGNQLNCTSCHLGNGAEAFAAPWNGMPGIYPIYRTRAGRVNTIQERINGCFERSMNGKPLDLASDDMNAMVSYMSWLSQDLPFGVSPEGRGFVKVDKSLEPNTDNGKKLFAEKCTVCHGENGEGQYNDDGTYLYPAVAGDKSFNDGAGMARTYTAASFIKGKMPFGQGNSLSDQEAVDIAAYFTHLPRPVKANKEKDWPNGDAPKDVRR